MAPGVLDSPGRWSRGWRLPGFRAYHAPVNAPALALGGIPVCRTAPMQSVAPELCLMTFNIRFAHVRPPNLWADRRPALRQVIQAHPPDVMGTQEGLYQQLVDMESDLPGYRWIGLGRNGGSRGEFMAVFYRPDRLTSLEFDHYWLSDTPRLIDSRSWGNRVRRMVTWVRFLELASGREFYVINTHLDHESQFSREKSAELICRHMHELDPELPVVLLGDFNAPAGSGPVFHRLTGEAGFEDTWTAVGNAEPSYGTYHAFKGIPGAEGHARIDWILTRGRVVPMDSRIVTDAPGGQHPSDHFPVVARVRLA
jgi:endonuclease/exonuclease/phosphatase family metal-dependent hydrolase